VPFKVEPVTSYEDLKRQGEPLKEPSAASTIVLIESGATVDLMQYLQPPAAVNILVIDSHRPVALENVFDNSQVLILDDGYLQEHQMALREATELLGDNTLDDDHSFDSEDEIENISPSRSGIRRGISKQTLGKANELLVDYYAGSWRACPSSRLALEIADSYNKIDNNMLWLGTLGCLEAYLLENMTEEYYRGDCYEYLRRHCLRLNPPEATQSSSSQFSSGSKESSPVANNSPMRVGRIRTDEEFKFFLLRHWNIQDAMRHSRYVVGNMQTWKDRGRRLLSEFFVAMGISLDACQRDFLVMDSQAKRKFGRQVLKFADQYGLRDIQSPSFSRDFGFDLTLSASDVVYAVMALIEQPHPKIETREVSWWRTNFPGAFSALVDVGQLRPGILTAIKQQKALLHEVHTILNHRLIRYGILATPNPPFSRSL
jgi:cell division control protein 45